MRDDYTTLIGIDSLGVVERDDDGQDVENCDVEAITLPQP